MTAKRAFTKYTGAGKQRGETEMRNPSEEYKMAIQGPSKCETVKIMDSKCNMVGNFTAHAILNVFDLVNDQVGLIEKMRHENAELREKIEFQEQNNEANFQIAQTALRMLETTGKDIKKLEDQLEVEFERADKTEMDLVYKIRKLKKRLKKKARE
jgi:hypothetical protein